MLDDLSKKRVKELCDLIAKEQDHQRFSTLISELNDLLERLELDGKPPSRNINPDRRAPPMGKPS